MKVRSSTPVAPSRLGDVELRTLAGIEPNEVLQRLHTSPGGLSAAEALLRLAAVGRNEIAKPRSTVLLVLARQFGNPFLILLLCTAGLSLALHDRSDALVVFAIVFLSVGLSFFNEFTAEKAVADLRARVQRRALVVRDGKHERVETVVLVPGDIVQLSAGDIVPADVRLIDAHALECDESALTGEALPATKSAAAVADVSSGLNLACCVYLGTVVKTGAATGVVVATGRSAALGAIARELTRRPPDTAFQVGLRDFSMLLVRVTVGLTATLFVANALLHHSWIESLMFSLAIAIGLTPQLLPAIVTISLAGGARRLARRSVIVKRLVAIEDLGNIEVLFTDKTGTLTEGTISFRRALPTRSERTADDILVLGLVCSELVEENGRLISGNALDTALWNAATPAQREGAAQYRVVDRMPFDYGLAMMSVVADAPDGRRWILSKGAPEAVEGLCSAGVDELRAGVDAELDRGSRTIALARREASSLAKLRGSNERELEAIGVLSFADEPKKDAAESLRRLDALKIAVKVVTGDHARTAQSVCREIGLPVAGVLTGKEIAALSDSALMDALPKTTLFARVTPDQKSRIIRLQRSAGRDVGFLGDGVNDAIALHDADVGISVDSAADVAKDAADIVLLEKDLGILADGVIEGRRVFANTTKYVLMGTSSNFGNMFSAAGASLFLPFLPMLPSQILLNNLLYDLSEMAIPSDAVDAERLLRPAHWDMRFIRRFMAVFGPISSIFDFVTFGVMLFAFHAGPQLFRTGWFVESLATQGLVIFLIRTRRIPFFASRPSPQLIVATLGVVCVAVALPFTPFAAPLGFVALPVAFFGVLGLMVVTYLGLIELGKYLFYRSVPDVAPVASVPSMYSAGPA